MLQQKIQSQDAQEHLPTLLAADALELAHQLQQHQKKIFPPQAQKQMRLFSPAEAAAFQLAEVADRWGGGGGEQAMDGLRPDLKTGCRQEGGATPAPPGGDSLRSQSP